MQKVVHVEELHMHVKLLYFHDQYNRAPTFIYQNTVISEQTGYQLGIGVTCSKVTHKRRDFDSDKSSTTSTYLALTFVYPYDRLSVDIFRYLFWRMDRAKLQHQGVKWMITFTHFYAQV